MIPDITLRHRELKPVSIATNGGITLDHIRTKGCE
jgi:hypothetical protein